MTKLITVSGMSCEKCAQRVEECLTAIGCVTEVDLASGTAKVTMGTPIGDDSLTNAIMDEGFTVVQIKTLED